MSVFISMDGEKLMDDKKLVEAVRSFPCLWQVSSILQRFESERECLEGSS